MLRAIDKLEPFQKAISKAHLASAGVSIDSLDHKPLIAVANSWNEICQMCIRDRYGICETCETCGICGICETCGI